MIKYKPKPLEKLKQRAIAHYKLYKEYKVIGKLRAEGRLSVKGNVKYEKGINNETFTIETDYFDDKSRPHFKGKCQAIGTGDVFNVAAWINKEGNLRFEIYETEGYSQITTLPF